jgi:glyoxylase-like metal-dependent hydrolase (beta-lactamase superfamily II)
VRAVALHPDVLLATSAIWQTNCAVVRGALGDRDSQTFLVDSPILPEELDALPTLLAQARFPAPSGLLATHGDWDHLLGRLAFPGASLGCAQSTAARLRATPGDAQRELRAFDEQYLIERPRPLALAAAQALPVPGRCAVGELELELYPTAGHTEDGMAIWVPWARVLLVGDYLSAVEIPTLDDPPGALSTYRATLERLRPLVESAEHVVPGHGPVLAPDRGLAILEEDAAYLDALAAHGGRAGLPPGRNTAFQRRLHGENAARVGRAGQP